MALAILTVFTAGVMWAAVIVANTLLWVPVLGQEFRAREAAGYPPGPAFYGHLVTCIGLSVAIVAIFVRSIIQS